MSKSGVILMAAMLAGHAAPALCASAGGEAAPFLKIDSGARAAAMGGAFTAIADDSSAVFYNPAGAGLMNTDDLMLSHSEWVAGLKNEHFGYVHPVSQRVALLTGFNLLISPSMDKYDGAGLKTGTFSAMDGALSAGLALTFTADSGFGLLAKGISQSADSRRAYAYAADAGYIQRLGNLKFGLAVQNLGAPLKLYKTSFALPLTFRGGAAYRLNEQFWFAADAFQTGAGLGLAAGAEGELAVTPAETAFLRTGYRTGGARSAGPGFTLGAGLKSGELRFDYAFAPYGDLGDSHRLTVSFKFGGDREYLTREKKLRKVYRKAENADAISEEDDDQPAPDRNNKKKSGKEPPKKEVYFMW